MTGLDLEDLLYATRNDPDAFNEVFINDGKYFWSRQREMCESVVKYRRTIVYSGNMIGKDFVVGRLVWWWLLTRPGSLVMITGPSQTSLGSITWKEVRQAMPRVDGSEYLIRAWCEAFPRGEDQSADGKPGARLGGHGTFDDDR